MKKAEASSRHLVEFRSQVDQADASDNVETSLTVGDKLIADIFSVGDMVQVVGTSKGKGFAGTIKRHNFARGPKTHGSHNYRAPGSIGAGYPQHVFKGQKMAGRMGHDTVTVKNLMVVMVDAEKNLIGVRGAVPGPKKGLVRVQGIEQ
jgi:large subunit ribosomal protein L3